MGSVRGTAARVPDQAGAGYLSGERLKVRSPDRSQACRICALKALLCTRHAGRCAEVSESVNSPH